MTSEKGKASDEVFKLTQEVKENATKYNPWEVTGADLVGIIPAERFDEIPIYRQDWMNTSTMKTMEQMKDAAREMRRKLVKYLCLLRSY